MNAMLEGGMEDDAPSETSALNLELTRLLVAPPAAWASAYAAITQCPVGV